MTILKASRLKAVLDRARDAGQVEESVRIAGLDLVFSSLVSEAYNAILDELKDVPETSYAMCYQVEHVCRSLVQVDEESFRGVDFIEVDAASPGAPPVRVERHQWLKDNLISTWSREMVQIAFRKVMDAIKGAEERAAEGVQFRVETETDEETYRRLLAEVKEAGAELPDEMREAILKEEGLLVATSKAELTELDERSRSWAQSAEEAMLAPVEAAERRPPEEPPRAPQQLVQAQGPAPAAAASEPLPVPAGRVPLNQMPIHDPVPVNPVDQGAATANRRSPPPAPDQVHDLSRTARVAALEEDPNFVVLEREPRVDAQQTRAILEKPPVGGINAKYVSPQRRAGGLDPRRR